MVEVTLRVVECGFGLGIFGKLLKRQIGIAKQLCQRRITLLGGIFRLQFCSDNGSLLRIEVGLLAGLLCHKVSFALNVALLEFDVLFGKF